MLKGMTGFGTAQISQDDIKATVEIKSLNHKYFDITYYLPIGFGSIEQKIKDVVQKQISRGRVTVAVKLSQKSSQTIALNIDAAKKYMQHARKLQKDFDLPFNITAADLIKLPGVLETKETSLDLEALWPKTEKALKHALNNLINMRLREGKAIYADLSSQLSKMIAQIKRIKTRAQDLLIQQKKKMNDEEFSAFQKSNDINEELTRLTHYIEEMQKLLKNETTIGKQIDFVAQEMQRETNTIGSKLQDKIVASAVILLKSKVEKIREQSQNVE